VNIILNSSVPVYSWYAFIS